MENDKLVDEDDFQYLLRKIVKFTGKKAVFIQKEELFRIKTNTVIIDLKRCEHDRKIIRKRIENLK
jgi:hypothetical protein